ncbi:MAG: TIGR03016 family PEP-CTERM system-associated outer membrane protein [Geminicoccaceae bacterium]
MTAVAFLAAVTAAGSASAAPQLRPWLLIEQEFSDNIDLDPDDDRRSAFVTRVVPGVSFRGDTSRFQGGFDGALRTRYTTDGDDQGFRVDPTLTGEGEVELVPGALFLEGQASISQQVLNNAAAQTVANQDTVQVYRVSPVLRHRFGGFAVGELRYTFGQFLANSDQASNTTAHVGQASLASGDDFDRLRLALNNRIAQSIRSEASDIQESDSVLQAEYAVTRWFAPIAAGGHQRFDAGGSRADFDGPAYWGGLRWRPGRRTELTLTYGKRDDRFSPAAELTYRITENSRFVASYAEGLSTAQQRLSTNLSFIGIDRDTNQFIDERMDTPFDPRADPFNIDDEIVYIKAARVALGLTRGRHAFGIQGYFGREEDVDTGEEEEIYQANATWSRRLSRRLTFTLSGGFELTRFPTGRDDDEYLVQPGLRYQLSPETALFADYRHRWQNSNDDNAEYTENRVAVGVRLSR